MSRPRRFQVIRRPLHRLGARLHRLLVYPTAFLCRWSHADVVERGTVGASYFDCDRCGRALTHDEVEREGVRTVHYAGSL